MTVLEVLIAFFLPPVSVAMKKGLSSKGPDCAAAPAVRTHPRRHLRHLCRHPGVGTRCCHLPPRRFAVALLGGAAIEGLSGSGRLKGDGV